MSREFITRLLGRDGDTESVLDRYDPRLDRLTSLTGEGDLTDLDQPHLTEPATVDRETVRTQARTYQQQGVSAGGFVASYGVATEALVSAAFDEVREAVESEDAVETVDQVEAELDRALGETLDSMRVGVATYDQQRAAADGGTDAE
jgi:hypothetical protein